MALLSLCFILFLLLWFFLSPVITTLSVRSKRDARIVRNINSNVDAVIPDIVQQLRNWELDPLPLGDLSSSDLSDCYVHGLSSVFRAGNCYVTFVSVDHAILQADIAIERIHGSCRFSKRYWLLRYTGMISLEVENVTSFVRISQKMEPSAHPVLEYLDVEVPRSMQIRASGDTTVQFVINALELFYKRRMRHLVQSTLTLRFHELISEYLRQITLDDLMQMSSGNDHRLLFYSTPNFGH